VNVGKDKKDILIPYNMNYFGIERVGRVNQVVEIEPPKKATALDVVSQVADWFLNPSVGGPLFMIASNFTLILGAEAVEVLSRLGRNRIKSIPETVDRAIGVYREVLVTRKRLGVQSIVACRYNGRIDHTIMDFNDEREHPFWGGGLFEGKVTLRFGKELTEITTRLATMGHTTRANTIQRALAFHRRALLAGSKCPEGKIAFLNGEGQTVRSLTLEGTHV